MSNKGILTISIDTEIAWGQCDRPLALSNRAALERERGIIQRLLVLFRKHDIRATWAVVGHLLVLECSTRDGVVHPEIPRPVLIHESQDWFFQHPPADSNDPLWYGRDIVELIRRAVPTQEIGSHSFCHMPYDESRSNPEAVRADLATARAIHEAHGLAFESFVFPRNVVGFREFLKANGIQAYRGNSRRWYNRLPLTILKRVAHLATYLVPVTPPTVSPQLDTLGLINIPDSMLLMGRNGLRRIISSEAIVRKAKVGLDRAVARNEVFHLWFHPSNFAHRTEEQFQTLEKILIYADELRKSGDLEVLTMGDHIKAVKGTARAKNLSPSSKAAQWREQAVVAHDNAAQEFRAWYDEMQGNPFASSFAYGRLQLEAYLVEALREVRPGGRVLDAGCGTGDQLRLLRKLGYEAIGLEPAAHMRRIAEQRNPGAQIHDGMIGALPFPDAHFDAVIAIEVLRYLHRSDVMQAYGEVFRILKPGGLFIFTMVNRYALDGFFLFDRIREWFGCGQVHCEFVTPAQVRRDLCGLGVKDIQCTGRLILPLRIVYRIHPALGAWCARWCYPSDLQLSRYRWVTALAGHLIVKARRPDLPGYASTAREFEAAALENVR